MAAIKAIEAQSVHQIQSGQVIVDLCSVVKELVENGLDAGANSLEVRFKNNGLDSIEVQDNGTGIAPANYEKVALKHHTSKLAIYDDLSSLKTFGFRGEALSSLCALSTFYMTTAQADEAPKGNRLDFETSGRLKKTSVVACQKGTTAMVEGLFEQLPVRRKELSKNIKREYGKVIGLLHAYACVCVGVRFSVKNTMPKCQSVTVFATKANATTRENIANVYGAKTLQALVELDLNLNVQSTLTQKSESDVHSVRIKVHGHISRPVFGEGRQTPDRQMFFVNGRPCSLPQIAKAINEVYKSFNVSQSPFIFADFQMDTNAYDVNVSPDKRTIMLHNATALIERLKESLNDLFERQDQTVPQSQVPLAKPPTFKQPTVPRNRSLESVESDVLGWAQGQRSLNRRSESVGVEESAAKGQADAGNLLPKHFLQQASTGEEPAISSPEASVSKLQKERDRRADKGAKVLFEQSEIPPSSSEYGDFRVLRETAREKDVEGEEKEIEEEPENIHVRNFDLRMAEQQRLKLPYKEAVDGERVTSFAAEKETDPEQGLVEQYNVVQRAFDHMRPKRSKAELAIITIGSNTTTTTVGTALPKESETAQGDTSTSKTKISKNKSTSTEQFSLAMRKFGAPNMQIDNKEQKDDSPAEHHEAENDESDASDKDSSEGEVSESIGEYINMAAPPVVVHVQNANHTDLDFVDEVKEKFDEKVRVAELIRTAEESAIKPSRETLKRANKVFRATNSKDATTSVIMHAEVSMSGIKESMLELREVTSHPIENGDTMEAEVDADPATESAEEKLALTISRDDFAVMEIIGQFNLGFILGLRTVSRIPNSTSELQPSQTGDELFIIDQHASDEKYNFERLQAETIIDNQRLVHPITLDLTAVEEEIILENIPALEKNGFIVEVDTSGNQSVGQRCKLLTLPLSKEVVFDTKDLDELIHLLAESPTLNDDSQIPRPTKVRKMFAMRACRSSIMIGRTLSKRQMEGVLKHMGEIQKPWNCPHGRPTMRHLTNLNLLRGWREGDGLADDEVVDVANLWKHYGT